MNYLRHEDIERLAKISAGPAVSVYMPVTSDPSKRDENRIRLKNLLNEAERDLIHGFDLDGEQAEAILAPGRELIAHGRYGATIDDGLALFLSPTHHEQFSLPAQFAEQAIVSTRYHLRPLIRFLGDNGRYYLLTLSQNASALWQGTPFGLTQLPLADHAPTSLAEALQWDDPEQHLDYHTSTASDAGKGSRPASFHGHGVTSDEQQKENILRYLQQVDDGVNKLLAEEQAPLLLVGVDYLLGIYRQANNYHHLVKAELTGNPENLDQETLRQKAVALLQPIFDQTRQAAVDKYHNLKSTNEAGYDLARVVLAAHYGQVNTLFTTVRRHIWGQLDASSGMVTIHGVRESGDIDLLDVAAVQTYLQGGTVYDLPEDEMPDGEIIAAVYRYPITNIEEIATP